MDLVAISHREPYYRTLGIMVEEKSNGSATLRMDGADKLFHHGGVYQGGAISSLLDAATAQAADSLAAPEQGVTTVELKVNYIRGTGQTVWCKAEVVHRGASLMVVTGRIEDAAGTLIAIGQCTMKIIGPW